MLQNQRADRTTAEFVDDTTDAAKREASHRARGTARPITLVGNPVLHRECAAVTEFDEALAALIDDMFASQHAATGVGLAANQIGVALKVFVYDCHDDHGVRHVGHVINPVIDPVPVDDRVLDASPEGCLSVPGAFMELARPDEVVCRGKDRHGDDIAVRGTGNFARCLQHETDHLNGWLYIDRLSKRDRKQVMRQMAERRPDYATVPND
ncbi:peptide deformylase [Streptomyces sp. NPDC101110]|uniref:peptide deformylase n=1 Tax=unclassified Streptomyces TaxID=2593676 RepID=UPI00381C14FC